MMFFSSTSLYKGAGGRSMLSTRNGTFSTRSAFFPAALPAPQPHCKRVACGSPSPIQAGVAQCDEKDRTVDMRKSVRAHLLDTPCIARRRLGGVSDDDRWDMQGEDQCAVGRLVDPALWRCRKRAWERRAHRCRPPW